MAIAVVFEAEASSIEKYLEVFEVGGSAIANQPARLSHVCYRTETGFTVVDVWESEEALAQFRDVLNPALAKVGVSGEPKIFPVARTVSQDGRITDYTTD